jgi:diguanylate cyclase (GGDEF)-like protein/PAS domain S-box-containing protein
MQVPSTDVSDAPAGPVWWGTAAAVVALCALTTAVSRTEYHEAVYTPAALLLAGAFAFVVRHRRLRPTAGWTIFASGLVLLALGDGVYALPWTTDIGSSGLSLADPLYVLGSVVIVAGALRLKSAHVGEGDSEASIDATSIALATAVLLWRPLIEPRFTMADTPLLARVVNASYPILDVVVVAMMLWLLLGARRWTPTTVMLVGGSIFYLFADFAYTVRIDQGSIDDPTLNWFDTLWLIAYGLYLLAALHPSARLLDRAVPSDERSISRGRLALSGMTLLAPMIALGIVGVDLPHIVFGIAVEVALIVLVLLRLSDLAAGERRARQAVHDRERYFRSLVQNSSEAMLVFDRDGTVTDASPAVQALLGVSSVELVGNRASEVVPGLDRATTESVWSTLLSTPDVVITAEVPITTAAGTRWLEMRATNLLADPAVSGLVINVHDVTARRQVQSDLERRAFTDSLTGLPNRALFHDRLEQFLSRRERQDLAVIYCDLDRFKEVNDHFGHAEGDRLLEVTGALLAAAVRSEDTVARLGGDEFAVLISGTDALEVAEEIAGRIVEELRRSLVVGSEAVPVSVSVGVACAKAGSADGARVLLHSADEAMYRAKRAGGDRVVVLGSQAAQRAPIGDRGPSAALGRL